MSKNFQDQKTARPKQVQPEVWRARIVYQSDCVPEQLRYSQDCVLG